MSDRTRREQDLPQRSLGKQRQTPFSYDRSLLEAVPFTSGRAHREQSCWVSLACLRFTTLCPVTGQPDWAELAINYLPRERLVESKSLKEYLGSFRMHGDFHEDVCRLICDDLVELLAPRYLELCGHFDSRGSIAIWPYVQYADPDDADAQALLRHRRDGYAPGRWAPPRDLR